MTIKVENFRQKLSKTIFIKFYSKIHVENIGDIQRKQDRSGFCKSNFLAQFQSQLNRNQPILIYIKVSGNTTINAVSVNCSWPQNLTHFRDVLRHSNTLKRTQTEKHENRHTHSFTETNIESQTQRHINRGSPTEKRTETYTYPERQIHRGRSSRPKTDLYTDSQTQTYLKSKTDGQTEGQIHRLKYPHECTKKHRPTETQNTNSYRLMKQ